MTSNNPNTNLLDTVETLSVTGSICAAIASVVFNHVALASIPISASLAISLMNRRRLVDTINHNNQTAIAQLIQADVQTQGRLEIVNEQVAEIHQYNQNYNQILNNNQTALEQIQAQIDSLNEQLLQLSQQTNGLSSETLVKIDNLNNQILELKHQANDLSQVAKNLPDTSQIQLIHEVQTQIASKVNYLQEIETSTQTIRLNANDAQAYYKRGLSYQELGDKEGAIRDYSQAIELNPSYAQAYLSRGLNRADLGDKRGAVADLREAAKHFFEEGDIAHYQTAKDLSKQFHELSSEPVIENSAPVEAIDNLFS